MSRGNSHVVFVAAAAALICLLVYLKALSCGFVNWEDQDYVLNNMAIRNLDSGMVAWAFTSTPVASFWLPLTYISFALDFHFWGLDPFGYHLTNIILHAANCGLVVLVADQLFRGSNTMDWSEQAPSWLYPVTLLLAALLFGLHPLRVESVAWVTERRGVLNGLFTLSALFFYLRFQLERDHTGFNGAASRDYILSLVFFLCSLMAKPTSIVLPAMLLALDWYPLGRLTRERVRTVLAEKIPYLLFSTVVIAIPVLVKVKEGTFYPLSSFPMHLRAIAAGNALFEYTRLQLFPVDILPYYDLPPAIPPVFIFKGLAVVAGIAFCIYRRKQWPWLMTMALCFFIPIIPTLHIFAGGLQIILAARYTYLPSIVPCIILAGLAAAAYMRLPWLQSRNGRLLSVCLLCAVFSILAGITLRLIPDWKDSGTMWTRVIEHKAYDKAYFFRGLYYVDSGNSSAAIADYTSYLEIAERQQHPERYNLYAFRGEALARAGRYEEAVKDFDAAIAMAPHPLFFRHRAAALLSLGRTGAAAADLAKAGSYTGQIVWVPSSAPRF